MPPEFVACPDPECGQPAEVLDRFNMESTDGPVEHVKIHCIRRHNFLMPGHSLTAL